MFFWKIATSLCQTTPLNPHHDEFLHSLAQHGEASFGWHELWIPNNLPEMSVRVLEVTGITAPEGVLGRLDDDCASSLCFGHHRIDLCLGCDVVTERKLGRARMADGKPSVMGQTLPWPASVLFGLVLRTAMKWMLMNIRVRSCR